MPLENLRIAEAYQKMCNGCTKYGMQPMNEVTLNRILHKKHFTGNGLCMVSASRGERTVEENNAKTEELKNDLSSLGYGYIPMYGGFKEKRDDGSVEQVFEKSFMVFPYNRKGEEIDFEQLKDDMLALGKKYEQESILVKAPDAAPVYLNCTTGDVDMEFSKDDANIKVNDMAQDYFSSLKKLPKGATDEEGNLSKDFEGKPQRFTFESCYLNEEPKTLMGAHARYMAGECYAGRYP